jgi:hypothetical protein
MSQPIYEELLEENRRLRAELEQLREENEALRQRLAELEGKQAEDELPSFVKPRRQVEDPQKPGRKPGHRGETRAVPAHVDEEQELRLSACPDCATPLGAPTEVRERYVEDLLPARAQVIRYRIARYRCPGCRRLVERKPEEVLPGHHLSLRAMATIVYLREELRLPVNRVQQYLADVGLKVSGGTIERVCSQVAERLSLHYETLKAQARRRKGVGLDETGLRVNGANHWMWGMATAEEVVYHPDKRRSHEVAEELLGPGFGGTVICDFYSAYNPLGVSKQRCWVHLLRETAKLSSEEGQALHRELKASYRWIESKLGRSPPPGRRERWASFGEWELEQLARREWSDPECQRIAKRLAKHACELYRWVRQPGVEATNNGTERALRPYVVKRKISGGHRSWAGARTHAILLSVLETCRRRGEDFRSLIESTLKQAVPSTG